MGAIEHLTISVPAKTAQAMRAQVTAGRYADLSELIEDALLSLALDRYVEDHPITEEVFEREVMAALDEYDRDPSTALTADQVLANLRADLVALEARD